MKLNECRCDYLTLTTFQNYAALMSAIGGLYPSEMGKRTSMGGYEGMKWEGMFFGSGRQKGQAHFMMRSSGEDAETIFWRTSKLSTKCTRIDLQITIDLPSDYSARTLFDFLSDKNTEWPYKVKNSSIIQSGDGLDTVYIGSRSSERFYRLYIKPDGNGDPAFLRFEAEIKGKTAAAVRDSIINYSRPMKDILAAELNTLPVTFNSALQAFADLLGDNTARIKPESVYTENKTFTWLETQVEPAILRLLFSHQHNARMNELLERWVLNNPKLDL